MNAFESKSQCQKASLCYGARARFLSLNLFNFSTIAHNVLRISNLFVDIGLVYEEENDYTYNIVEHWFMF